MNDSTFDALRRVMTLIVAAYNSGQFGKDRQLYEDVQRVIVWMDNKEFDERP
jgi:hypothetical protein